MTEIIAHRGTPRELPENTIPGFLRAIEQGADAIELDVHATRDGVVVVHHDFAPRAPGHVPPTRKLADLTLADLERYPLEGGVPIPTLAQVLGAVGGRAAVYVEIKATGIEQRVVDVIGRANARCSVHSFDHRIVRRVRELAPVLPTGVLLASYLLDLTAVLRGAGASDLWEQWEHIDQPLVDEAKRAGARVIAWTVNEPEDARRLASMGVAGICTDLPGLIAASVS